MRLSSTKRPTASSLYNLLKEEGQSGPNGGSERKASAEMDGLSYKMAIRIQRFWRRMRITYGQLGPYHFLRKDGDPACFGSISFAQNAKPAPFIILSDATPAPMLGHFIERFWNLSRPEVLISVTGGAQTFALDPALRQAFDRGLADACTACSAWVLTGGTDTGVMQLVAKALARYEVKQPLIAIAPYGAVLGRDALEGQYGQMCDYDTTEAPSFHGAPLNPFHTHYVLVDAGVTGGKAWGTEQALRARVERDCCAAKGVPQALLVVQGGPGTLTMLLESARRGSSILIVSESGGAATAVFEFVKHGRSHVDAKFQGKMHILEEIATLHEENGGTLLTFFSLEDGDDFATQLLHALIHNLLKPPRVKDDDEHSQLSRQDSLSETSLSLTQGRTLTQLLRRTLLLVIRWDRADMLYNLLESLTAETAQVAAARGVRAEPFTYGHHLALQQIVELRRGIAHLVELTECTGFTCSSVNMCRLYHLSEDPYRIISSDEDLQHRIDVHRREIDALRPYDDSHDAPESTFPLFQEVVGPFLEKHSPSCAQILRSRQSSKVCERDLFFWSILQGDRAYMLFWWKRCGHPLRLALIGAAFARTISTLRVVGLGRTALEDISVLLEGWAVGLISSIDGQEDAFAVLASTVCAWGQRSGAGAPLLDLAMRLEMKTFLSHKHCQALMELWWRGGYYGSAVTLEPNAMMVEVALYAIAPFLNPYLLNCRGHEVAERKVSSENEGLLSIGASAMGLIIIQRNIKEQLEAAAVGKSPAAVTRMMKSRCNLGSVLHKLDHPEDSARERKAVEDRLAASRPKNYTRDFYEVPMVKMATRACSHLVLMLLYTRTLLMSHDTKALVELARIPAVDGLEMLFFVFAIGHSFDQRYQRLMSSAQKASHAIPFMQISYYFNTFLVFAVIARIVSVSIPLPDAPPPDSLRVPPESAALLTEPGTDDEGVDALSYDEQVANLSWSFHAAMSLYKFNTVALSYVVVVVFTIQVMIFRCVADEVGVLVIVIEGMMTDLALFLEIFAFTIIGFCLAFVGLSPHTSWGETADDADDAEATRRFLRAHEADKPVVDDCGAPAAPAPLDMGQVLALPLWGVYGELSLLTLKDIDYSQPLMFGYVLISTVVLVNLLVAMFSDTYTRIQSAAEKEYRLQKTARTYLYRNVVLAVPPPLNLPYVVYHLLTGAVERATAEAAAADAHDDGTAVEAARSRMYLEGFLKRMDDEEEGTIETMVKHLRDNDLKAVGDAQRRLHAAVESLAQKSEAQQAALTQSLKELSDKVEAIAGSEGAEFQDAVEIIDAREGR